MSSRKRCGRITRTAAIVVAGAIALSAQPAFEVASVRPHRGSGVRSGPLYTVSSPLIGMEGYTVAVRAMLRSLLADRFKLGVHHETKEMPVYVLQVGKNGAKLKASPPGGQC